MAVAAARTAVVKRTIKPHVPLIQFPPRGSAQAVKGHANTTGKLDQFFDSVLVDLHPAHIVSKGPAIEATQIPLKYRRKILTKEEMECIEKGGPV